MTSSIESEIRNGELWISTLDKIYEDQTIIVYDCRDLIPPETQERADESPSPAGAPGSIKSRLPPYRNRGLQPQ